MQAYSDLLVDHNEKTDSEELNGGMGTRAMTSEHFPEKLRRAGVPEFPGDPNTLCPHLFPVRVPGAFLLVRSQLSPQRDVSFILIF